MTFDIKTSKILNDSKSGNFVFAPVGNICNVQIFDRISMESCGEMVGQLATIISQLPAQKPTVTASTKITSPYNISPDVFVFDVAINSGGGDLDAYKSVMSMFALAKSRGAIVRTNNIGFAGSAASLLFVQGTPGYRIMSDTARTFIHYGKSTTSVMREVELDIVVKNTKDNRERINNIYQTCTNLTDEEIKRFLSIEGSGDLSSSECLFKGICDWILRYDGKLFSGHNR